MKEHDDNILEALSAALDGECSPEEEARLQTMVHEDESLQAIRDTWSEIGGTLKDKQDIPVPDAQQMLAGIQREIQTAQRPQGRLVPFSQRWLATAAALLVLLGGWYWLGSGSTAIAEPAMWVETHVPDSSAVVYEDKELGVTVIWMVTETDEMQDG